MSLNEDVRNCRIVVRDTQSGRTIVDTTILTYDKATGQVTIASEGIDVKEGSLISALVFSSAGLYESQGTVAVNREKCTVITLYEGTDKDGRQAVRYRVNIRGIVDYVAKPSGKKIREEFEINVLNMSAIGILMQAPQGKIRPGDTIRFSALSKGQRLNVTVEATRVAEAEEGKENIGCSVRLLSLG